MTSATSTPALLPGSPAPEGLPGQSDPAVGCHIFASLLSQAVLRPGVESPRVAVAEAASDETPGPQTQRAPGKGPRRKDQDSEASQIPCWLPDLLTASCRQPSPGAGGCVPSAPVSTAAAAGGDNPPEGKGPDASPGQQPGESATAAGGLLLVSGSFCAEAGSRAEVVEQLRAAAAKGSTAEPAASAAAPRTAPATRLEPGSAPETRAKAWPPANLASVENEGLPAEPSAGPIPRGLATDTGPTAPDAGSSRQGSETGMSVASDNGAMLAPREVNENACQAEQNLPVWVAGSELPQGAGRERKAGVAAGEPAAAMPSGGGEAALAVPGHSAGHELAAHSEPLRDRKSVV
jgi:hypothetical protein